MNSYWRTWLWYKFLPELQQERSLCHCCHRCKAMHVPWTACNGNTNDDYTARLQRSYSIAVQRDKGIIEGYILNNCHNDFLTPLRRSLDFPMLYDHHSRASSTASRQSHRVTDLLINGRQVLHFPHGLWNGTVSEFKSCKNGFYGNQPSTSGHFARIRSTKIAFRATESERIATARRKKSTIYRADFPTLERMDLDSSVTDRSLYWL